MTDVRSRPSDIQTPATSTQSARGAAGGGPSRLLIGVFVLVVFVAPAVFVTAIAVRSTELSVIDEYGHVDVLRRVEDFGYPREGDQILPETAHDVGCRTIGGRAVGTCDDPPEVVEVDALGYSYQAQHPPLYYVVTAGLRQLFRLGPVDGFVLSARLTGMVWLSAGLGALWFALRRFGADSGATAATVALVAVSPVILFLSASVNNDASVLLLGSGALFAFDVLRRDPTPRQVALVCAGVFVAMYIKPTALLAVGAVALAVVVDALFARRRLLPVLLVAALPAVVAIAGVLSWETIRDARAVVPFDEVMEVVLGSAPPSEDLRPEELVAHADEFLGVYHQSGPIASPISQPYLRGLAGLATFALLAAPVTSLLVGDRRPALLLGASALVVAVVGAAASVVQYHMTYGVDGGAPLRYGLSLLPLFALGLSQLLTGSRRGVVIVGLLAASIAVSVGFAVVEL